MKRERVDFTEYCKCTSVWGLNRIFGLSQSNAKELIYSILLIFNE